MALDSINRCNIYSNTSFDGNDLFSGQPLNICLDTFTVLIPTAFHAYPPENFTFDILHGKLQQATSDVYVSPSFATLDFINVMITNNISGEDNYIGNAGGMQANSCFIRFTNGNICDNIAVVDKGAYEYGSVGVGIDNPEVVGRQSSAVCYPNPFSDFTTIEYELFEDGMVTLVIFNYLGQEVCLLINELQPKGRYQVKLDAEDLKCGIYFYRLSGSGDHQALQGKLIVSAHF